MTPNNTKGLLLVANWDSNVGYAWWLMESFWIVLSEQYHSKLHSILTYPSISIIPEGISQANIEIVNFDFTKISIAEVYRQCRFILRNKIHTIYFTDLSYRHWRYTAFKLCGVKRIIIHDHTPGLRTNPQGLKKFLKNRLARWPLINADAIIGVTDYIQQRAIKVACVPDHKTYSAPNGLATPTASTALDLHQEFNIPAQQKILITTGRASRYKGILFAIECMAELVHTLKRNDLHWLFCGDGSEIDEFRDKVKQLKLSDYISMPGKRADIPNILLGCDFSFHPSKGEVGYSLSILEYMRAGLPVIVSDNISVCSATEDQVTGLIYAEENIQSACKAIVTLLDNPELASSMKLNSKQEARKYTLENTHTHLLSAFKTILKTTPFKQAT